MDKSSGSFGAFMPYVSTIMEANNGKNDVCGFVPLVLSRPATRTLVAVGAGDDGRGKKEAVFNPSFPLPSLPKKTLNRKYITRSSTLIHEGAAYQINNYKSGIYTKIIHRAIEELEKGLLAWGRVFAPRFDLHHKGIHRPDNKWLSRFIKNLKRRLIRSYGIADMGYFWVREQERGKAQHYHVVLYLDGDLVRHPARLNALIVETWGAINPINTVYHPKNSYYFVDSEKEKGELIYRLSYMAKARGKGYRADQVKDFQCSRMNKKQPTG